RGQAVRRTEHAAHPAYAAAERDRATSTRESRGRGNVSTVCETRDRSQTDMIVRGRTDQTVRTRHDTGAPDRAVAERDRAQATAERGAEHDEVAVQKCMRAVRRDRVARRHADETV